MIDTAGRYNGVALPQGVPYYANIGASDVLKSGMALCYDDDNATLANKYTYLAKPTYGNYKRLAGFVSGPGRVGPGPVDITPIDGGVFRGASLYTDESVAAGDYLGVIPGSYAFGKCVIGRPVAMALEAQDRSTTAGLVVCDVGLGFIDPDDFARKSVRFRDDFTGVGSGAVSGADVNQYELTGTGATLTYADALAIGATDAAVDATKRGTGVGLFNALTTGFEVTAHGPGEPFALDAHKNLFMRARAALSAVTAETQAFIGLSLAGTTDMIDACGTDAIGFRILNTVLDFIYGKDATSSAIETATGYTSAAIASPAVAADVFLDLAFMVRNKSASKELSIWVNGTLISHTVVEADICNDESLSLCLAVADSGADSNVSLKVDRIEINNYVG